MKHAHAHALLRSLLASTMLLPVSVAAQDHALPTGGQVAAGQAAIAAAGPGGLRIVQTSDRAVIDWRSFSIRADARVDIAQPGAASALLNRVTSGATSVLAGQLNANGQVYLVNPNGIVITRTGQVNAAGFIASTQDIDRDAFMAGSVQFMPGAAAGQVRPARGGYAGVLDGSADGLVAARVLTDGEGRATLDLSGDGFMQAAVPVGGISVAGRITADTVVLNAATARDAVRRTVNLSGVIEARGVEARGGSITLTGGDIVLAGATIDASGDHGGGSVRIGGDWQGGGDLSRATTLKVDAATIVRADATVAGDGGRIVLWSDDRTDFAGFVSARGAAGGTGGDAEVSGKDVLNFTGRADLTGATFGTLLLDPRNLTIAAAASQGMQGFNAIADNSILDVNHLTAALRLANVVVYTGTTGTQAGDITVAAPIAWNSTARLTLQAARSIRINADIDVQGGGKVALLNAQAGNGGEISYAIGASINFAPGHAGQAFSILGEGYTLVHSIAGLAAMSGSTWRFALAQDLDFQGIEASASPVIGFGGLFDGLGHVARNLNLAINSGTGSNGLALFDKIEVGGIVRNIGVVDASVVVRRPGSTQAAAPLVGWNKGLVEQSYATGGSVTGTSYLGGLVGINSGTIRRSFSTVDVAASSTYAGGLTGRNQGSITQSYATGSVIGFAGVGGFVGYTTGTISQSYSTGAVSDTGGQGWSGGFAGTPGQGFQMGAVTQSYFTSDTAGMTRTFTNASAVLTSQLLGLDGNALNLGPDFAGGKDGVAPYLTSFYPNGVHAVWGTAYTKPQSR